MDNNGNMNNSGTEKNRTQKNGVITAIRVILIIICLGVCVFSGYKIILSIISNKKADDIYGDIGNEIDSIIKDTETDSEVIIWTRGDEPPTEPIDTDENTSSDLTDNSSEPTDVSDGVTEPGTDSEPIDSETETKLEETSVEIPTASPDTSDSDEPQVPTQSQLFTAMKSYISGLQKINPDVVGIIYIPMTVGKEEKLISLPVVLPDDNEYYLDHDIYGDALREGTIFLDRATDPNIGANKNMVVYGHNMFGEQMFHNLKYFTDRSVFMSTYIYFFTTEAIYVYEPFAVYTADATDGYGKMNFYDDKEYTDFLYNAQSNSIWKKYMSFYGSDRIITLSTCHGITGTSGRMAIHGVLVKIQK